MKVILILIALLLTACSPSGEEISISVVPDGLKDCKFYRVRELARELTIVRCPNSQTSVRIQNGKFSNHSSVVEGNEEIVCRK